jgi:dTDP-4-amino-4,6-dideoxygalactose transaminase
MSDSKLPFIVFGAPALEKAEIDEVAGVLARGWLGTGPLVARFERDFAAYKGVAPERVVALSSCTAALHLALVAAGVKPGDEVITTPLTFVATANAILHAGGTPVLADIDPATMNIDPREVERAITARTKAVIPVHFGGRACEMEPILALARRRNLKVIEDCAHAIESTYRGRPTGTLGDFGCFSFYVTKNVTAGEGGMVIAPDAETGRRLRRLSLHGMSADAWKRFGASDSNPHYDVVECGFKCNMMDLQAAIGIHQLERVEENWRARDRLWREYSEAFAGLPIDLPAPAEAGSRHGRHLFAIGVRAGRAGMERDAVLRGLRERGIGAGVHYRALPEHSFYREALGWTPERWPHAMAKGRETVSLPLGPHLTAEQVARVIAAVRDLLKPRS